MAVLLVANLGAWAGPLFGKAFASFGYGFHICTTMVSATINFTITRRPK